MSTPSLSREVGLGGAVVIGLGSMIGAGVFAVFAPAAESAGSGLLIALLIAAAVAGCNATSSAQLAAAYPRSGGTYVYGRERLGPGWGFLAGWSFVIGKTASCAAMAITFAAYAAPDGWERPVAAAAVALIALVNYRGVTRTTRLATVIVIIVLAVLAVILAAAASTGLPHLDGMAPATLLAEGWYGILQASGLLFFAFAGYARIATLGEEVKNPSHTIPRAILLALGIVVVVYAAVASATLGALGPLALASSAEPLGDAVRASGWSWADPLVQLGAAAASLGSLLGLMAGVGRTTLAMARESDLPGWLSAVHPRFHVPHRAEVVIAAVVMVLVLTMDLRGAIGFSSFGVLLYYFIANAAAFTQTGSARRYPRPVQMLGMVGCAVLVVTLPASSVAGGLVMLALGVGWRGVARAISRRRRSSS